MPGWSVRGSERSPTTAVTHSTEKGRSTMQNRRLSRRQFLAGTGLMGAGLIAAACAPHSRTRAHRGSCRSDSGARRNRCACGRHGREGRTGRRYDRRPDRLRRRRALPVRPRYPGRACHAGPASTPQGQEAREAGGHGHHRRRPVTGTCRGPPTSHRPSQQIFEEESGIKLEIVGIGADDQFTKIIQDTTTKAGGYDVYSFWLPDKGTPVRSRRASASG